jgi:hypothetical protein
MNQLNLWEGTEMPRYLGRKLIDQQGNMYMFDVPPDVNADDIQDVLLTAGQGVTKLLAYRLVGDTYRDVQHEEIADATRRYNFFKKLFIAESSDLTMEEFGVQMKHLIERARESRIGKVQVTEWSGFPVKQDGRGYYIEREVPCSGEACESVVKGFQRLSLGENDMISRAQSFIPADSNATRRKEGSKKWLCPACSVRHVAPPVEVASEPVVLATQEPEDAPGTIIKKKEGKGLPLKQKVLKRLLDLSSDSSTCDGQYLKGFVNAAMLILQDE